QPSMSLFLLESPKERNRQGPRPPPPSSSQRAATPAQRAVKTAASAENPVSETPAANQRHENVSSACAHSRSSRWSGGSPAGAGEVFAALIHLADQVRAPRGRKRASIGVLGQKEQR